MNVLNGSPSLKSLSKLIRGITYMLNSVFSYSNGCAIPPSSGKYFAENSFLPGLLEDMKINELRKPK